MFSPENRAASAMAIRIIGSLSATISSKTQQRGFTVLEILVVLLIIGILVTIAAPVCNHILNVMRLENAQEQVLMGVRQAQHNARIKRIDWEFGIRQQANGQVQWAIYPKRFDPVIPPDVLWQNMGDRVQLDAETTLRDFGGIRRVQFTHLGAVSGQLGRVTLSIKGGGRMKRCVIVSTLLGAISTGREQPTAVDGKYCR